MKEIIAILFLFVANSAQRADAKEVCAPLPEGFRTLEHSYSVAELEQLGLALAARNSAVPQLPFAYANSQWERFKQLYRPGDKLLEFDSPHLGPAPRTSPDGYVLMRGSCMIAFMGLRIA
ncbi:hypothetical protein WCE34_14240 [Luteimonas sp. MJ204]|uniref:hypothetical protein n=1 Tax=Luteimonas sp. MJ145 TaxID=3129234 RepID=UPI0031BB907F